MTAPARSKAAARVETEERDETARTTTKQPTKSAKPSSKQATKQAGGTKTAPKKSDKRRGRSAAADRAYARRDERREQSSRRPSQVRQGVEERRPVAARSRARKQLQEKVSTIARLPLVVVVMVVLATGLAATLWLSIAAVSGSYQLKAGEAEINSLTNRKEQLQREVSSMSSTPALQRRAEQELGMVEAPTPAHLVEHPDGSVAVVGDPQRATAPPPPAPPAPPARPEQQSGPQQDGRPGAEQPPQQNQEQNPQQPARPDPAAGR
ncbi:hypothetical protein [Saccharopolyspora griseoalba]|uniref:Cell division protein FtsL n=1 Tax=Saccharopolyspora griseoalba TaxID=1431848 RepID=A0ABW2LIL3_9PSEU